MNAVQKGIVLLVIIVAIALILHQHTQVSELREQVSALRQQTAEQPALHEQIAELERQRDRASNQFVQASGELANLKKSPAELHQLRGEVGRLRKENADMSASSPLSKITANPEAVKLLRDQQKMGMGMIYRGLAQKAKLTPEQTEKLNDLLADHIMQNISHVTTALLDKPDPEQLNRIFAAQESALQEDLRGLLGDDGAAKFQDYTQRLLSNLTAEQFKTQLPGPDASKDEKAKQIASAIQESVQEALIANGLPADYQTVPILNFRNIASEQEGERALKLLDDIYQRTVARGSAFLSAEDLAKFEEFRKTAVNNNRAALALNRGMMSPLAP